MYIFATYIFGKLSKHRKIQKVKPFWTFSLTRVFFQICNNKRVHYAYTNNPLCFVCKQYAWKTTMDKILFIHCRGSSNSRGEWTIHASFFHFSLPFHRLYSLYYDTRVHPRLSLCFVIHKAAMWRRGRGHNAVCAARIKHRCLFNAQTAPSFSTGVIMKAAKRGKENFYHKGKTNFWVVVLRICSSS